MPLKSSESPMQNEAWSALMEQMDILQYIAESGERFYFATLALEQDPTNAQLQSDLALARSRMQMITHKR